MDFDHGSSANKSFLVLQGDDDKFISNKGFSRNSSVSYSSRIYYYRGAQGVPFQWEMQPGTPKEPLKKEVLPPLSPSPAMMNLGLPKPCIDMHPKASTRSKFKFWKKSKKNGRSKGGNTHLNGSNKFTSFDGLSSDCEFMSLPRNSSSSSSSSFCFSIDPNWLQSSSLESPGRELHHNKHTSCSPWNVSAIFIGFARRN